MYWSFPHDYLSSFLERSEKGLLDNSIMAAHKSDLDSVAAYCRKNDIRLVWVAFPLFVFSPDHVFNIHTKDMMRYMEDKKIPVVDVDLLAKDLPLEQKIVNDSDPHASEEVNKLVSIRLIEILE